MNKGKNLSKVSPTTILGLPQGIDNQPHLGGGETARHIREPDPIQVVHQVRVIMNPAHQFLARGSGRDIRTIELGQFAFSISTYLKHFFISNLPLFPLTYKGFPCFIAPFRSLLGVTVPQPSLTGIRPDGLYYLCLVIERLLILLR